MRRIGQLSSEAEARRFGEYLELEGIDSRLESADGAWQVWILDEDQIAAATEELSHYQADPAAEKYRAAEQRAIAQRQAELDKALQTRRETLVKRRRRPRTAWQATPVSLLVIIACGMATAAIRFGGDTELTGLLKISEYKVIAPWTLGLPEIRSGQLWRLITPCLIHFDPLHLVGNVSWFYLLGRVIERTRKRSRFLLFLLVLGVGSNLAQYLMHGPNFGGLSGVDCGLFGFLWFKSQFRPEAGFHLPPEQTVLFAGWMLIALSGAVGPIANTAHLAGLTLGILLALPKSVPVFRYPMSDRH
ncbi:MAG: rhomboid family intramembrane serine protease [Planctomycetaceae bacterium]